MKKINIRYFKTQRSFIKIKIRTFILIKSTKKCQKSHLYGINYWKTNVYNYRFRKTDTYNKKKNLLTVICLLWYCLFNYSKSSIILPKKVFNFFFTIRHRIYKTAVQFMTKQWINFTKIAVKPMWLLITDYHCSTNDNVN